MRKLLHVHYTWNKSAKKTEVKEIFRFTTKLKKDEYIYHFLRA